MGACMVHVWALLWSTSCIFCGDTLVSAMISYWLAVNQTTSITSVIVALTLLRRLEHFGAVFAEITVRALSLISFGCAGNSKTRFEEECLGLIKENKCSKTTQTQIQPRDKNIHAYSRSIWPHIHRLHITMKWQKPVKHDKVEAVLLFNANMSVQTRKTNISNLFVITC